MSDRTYLDMSAITQEAMRRKWRLEFECDGEPFVVTVTAIDGVEAAKAGRLQLRGEPGFSIDRATLRSCVEC